MAKEWDPETVFDVLGDEAVRRVLAATNVQAASVRTLADGLDVSEPTVYRRVDTCLEYDLLTEETRVDPDGNHYKVYEANLERICYELDGGGFEVNIELRRDLVDRFSDFWRDLEGDADG